jgi:very-short-patch-repair endonuclease
MYRRQAIAQMAMCQKAVPAWIMPIGKAMDMFNPVTNDFDVIIVDEASQCDLSSIGILDMAKKIIIVGDDKQVSPLAVGMDVGRINALRDMYIKDIIPNWHLYESKTSLYDIAQTTFQPLMLREHFRCLPEIIGYSNKLSYDYKIKPLRDSGTAKILPSVVSYRVMNGKRDGRSKINIEEANTIVAIILACIELPEYAGMTFGVISLLGNEQAALIQTQILEQISAQIIEERRILCGNASHFQGDERDVILLSLVDSNEGDGPLRLTGEGIDASTKQRYNVAASRAKEQLWVVHSLDCTRDLKTGDMRRDLIEYATDPNAFMQLANTVARKSESPFEEAVGKSLVAAGYSVTQQHPVGAYRLDMVVSCGDNKVALECDGEAYHSSEFQVRSDMERQTILERIGWKFIRVRGSEYYRDPEKTISRIIDDLSERGIMPENKTDTSERKLVSALLERINIRVDQILDDLAVRQSDMPLSEIAAVSIPHPVENIQSVETPFIPPKPQLENLPDCTIFGKSVSVSSTLVETESSAVKVEQRKTQRRVAEEAEPKSQEAGNPEAQSNLFDKMLLSELDTINVAYVDNRRTGSFLWIIDSQDNHPAIEDVLKGSGVEYHFEKRGSVATGNKSAWRVK